MMQKKFLIASEHAEWLRDIAMRTEMTESDVLRDLIKLAHVALERHPKEPFSRPDELLDRRALHLAVVPIKGAP